jgi:hypothetical protein
MAREVIVRHTPKLFAATAARIVAAVVSGLLSGCALPNNPAAQTSTPSGPPAGLAHIIDLLGPVTKYIGCVTVSERPDPGCTPGAILSDASLTRICRKGYAHSERPPLSYTEPIKRADMAAYGYGAQPLSGYVLDHLVALEFGGSGYSRANLWIQTTTAAAQKDQVENYLTDAACRGQIALRTAQRAIARDWYAIYIRMTPAQHQQYTYGGGAGG